MANHKPVKTKQVARQLQLIISLKIIILNINKKVEQVLWIKKKKIATLNTCQKQNSPINHFQIVTKEIYLVMNKIQELSCNKKEEEEHEEDFARKAVIVVVTSNTVNVAVLVTIWVVAARTNLVAKEWILIWSSNYWTSNNFYLIHKTYNS